MRYQGAKPCPDCDGTRLRREARNVFLVDAVGGAREPIFAVEHFHAARVPGLLRVAGAAGREGRDRRQGRARDPLAPEVPQQRWPELPEPGSRAPTSLRGGEAQRIRLATQIGSQLTGVLYVLDEPTIGLHQRDNGKLIRTLKDLRDLGNTVLVVEHDEETMRAGRLT